MKTKPIFKQLGDFAFLFSGTFLIAALVLSFFPQQEVSAQNKINICHATGGGKYVSLSIDVSSLNKWETQGHGSHPNDIWASFTTEDGHLVAGQGDISILINGCEVPAAPTDTTVPQNPTDTVIPSTPTWTPLPRDITVTPVPGSPTETRLPPTPTSIPVAIVLPSSSGSNTLLPVTGVDAGAFWRGLPGALFNLCLGFLGLGLVLKGIARRFDE